MRTHLPPLFDLRFDRLPRPDLLDCLAWRRDAATAWSCGCPESIISAMLLDTVFLEEPFARGTYLDFLP
jgi:hypothetical protein